MPNHDHGISIMDTTMIDSILKTNTEGAQPIEYKIVEEVVGLDTNEDEEDYSYLILKLDHFQIGANSKDKSILQDVDFGVLIK